ncbi:hypothetical protein HHL21_11365 [Massilia sp. RP-1-19]|uniref:Thioredoxin family protein n=1 Tax=Massilia polaris TaxID=2728846 RepID=A0A848HKV1_9BURK|nr:hypothetical protein [Massilia polaris]NML61667.1 hypothetical protein [Massilia polaris]
MNQPANAVGNPADDIDGQPVLFHDGCNLCLDIAQTLERTIPGLSIIDLSLHPEFKFRAVAHGVVELPSLVVGTKVLSIAPHSEIAHIGAQEHQA